MRTSENIINIIYDPIHAEMNDEQYQKYKKIYLSLSTQLNKPLGDEYDKKVSLSVISQFIFEKRNKVSINKTSFAYRHKQAYLLPSLAPKFFPKIEEFLKNLKITCQPSDFDNAILGKIDIFTQSLYAHRDKEYFDLKNFFFQLENCSTPLDLLFRGLFYARAKQNIGKIKWIVFGFVITLLALILFGIL
jgi:hypothetical protein